KQSSCPRKFSTEMVFDVCLGGVQMVGSLCCASGSERSHQGRVLPDVRTADGKHVVLELRNRSVILKICGPVCVAIHQAGDAVRSALHVHAVAADLQVIVLAGCLPRHTPVGCDPPDIVGKSCACVGLGASDVF